MCIARCRQEALAKWNWDGGFIVQECIVPSGRPVIGRQSHYQIDVREFLANERNEVMRRTLRQDLKRHVLLMPGGDWALFESRQPGAFDYRVRVIADFVGHEVDYVLDTGAHGNNDPWQFPDETLSVRSGDCEDRALVIASLMLASGISSFHFRVALGKLHVGGLAHDHVWVMYKNEDGRWTVVDPPAEHLRVAAARARRGGKGRAKRTAKSPRAPAAPMLRYEPHFLFNDVHLWSVQRTPANGALSEWIRAGWTRIDPAFHGEVHLGILQEALTGVADQLLSDLERYFRRPILGLFGPIVDDIDRMDYDPVFHFDNGYITEGWQHVARHLNKFREDHRDIMSFAIAAHGIADFYAHSSYAHFARQANGRIELFDQAKLPLGGLAAPDYSTGALKLGAGSRFTVNQAVWEHRSNAAMVSSWQGKILSGRYAQAQDTQPGLVSQVTEGFTWIPKSYRQAGDFYTRGCLPHHDEMAVDEPARSKSHKLYTDDKDYALQYDLRRSAAVRHVRKAFVEAATRGSSQATDGSLEATA